MKLGFSLPFAVERVEATATLARGREVRLRFTRKVDPAGATNSGPWLSVEPPVDGLAVTMATWDDAREVRVRGGFGLGTNYVVRVGKALRSIDGTFPGDETRWTNAFAPLLSNAWLPAYDAVQPAQGGQIGRAHV